VLILQHPDEHRHALNTGRLAALGLQRAELLVGEEFPQLDAIVSAFATVCLLFPGDNGKTPQPSANPGGEPALLIVPDGTWRKARKILHRNPVLSTLPRLCLPPGAPSMYRVRKTHEPAAVSTIEAVVRTLAILEPDQDFSGVLAPFDVLIEQQIQAMGRDIYMRNYPEER
jgi:DTW domain-containing protein YfiP